MNQDCDNCTLLQEAIDQAYISHRRLLKDVKMREDSRGDANYSPEMLHDISVGAMLEKLKGAEK